MKVIFTASLFFSPLSFASVQNQDTVIFQSIQKDLKQFKSISFGSLLSKWENQYGTKAVPPLVKYVSNPKNPDTNRYIGILAIAKLGGRATQKIVSSFLGDRSWMVRNATIRAMTALGKGEINQKILQKLKDPALVVRTEAIGAIEKLNPKGSAAALVKTLTDQTNYRAGKPQFVPQRALKALMKLPTPKHLATKLLPLLDYNRAPKFQTQTIRVLEKITGVQLNQKGKLSQKIERWKKYLTKK